MEGGEGSFECDNFRYKGRGVKKPRNLSGLVNGWSLVKKINCRFDELVIKQYFYNQPYRIHKIKDIYLMSET